MSDYSDWCADCAAYGDDYYRNEDGELVRRCSVCGFNDDDEEYCD